MDNIAEPIDVVRNLETWFAQIQDAIKKEKDASIFDVYVVLRNNHLDLKRYLEMYEEAHKDDPVVEEIPDDEDDEE